MGWFSSPGRISSAGASWSFVSLTYDDMFDSAIDEINQRIRFLSPRDFLILSDSHPFFELEFWKGIGEKGYKGRPGEKQRSR
jgi:hypothetical protein